MYTHGNHIQSWQLQDAKARLSELVRSAITDGPQAITVRGRQEVMVLSMQDYENLTKAKLSFWQFIRDSPLVGCELNLDRDKSTDRDTKF